MARGEVPPRAMKCAYADPPYMGCAHRYAEKTEVDHVQLLAQLQADYPDGWALSWHVPSLRALLSLRPDDVRIAAWVKPFCVFKPNVNPAYAWEPLLWRGGRRRRRDQPTVRDWLAEPITLQRGMVGVKPATFCFWLFELLNLEPGDVLDDLYPGTGTVAQCLDAYFLQRAAWANLSAHAAPLPLLDP